MISKELTGFLRKGLLRERRVWVTYLEVVAVPCCRDNDDYAFNTRLLKKDDY